MSQTFDIKRFCRYFAYTFRLGRKTYLTSLCALVGGMLIPVIWPLLFGTEKILYGIDRYNNCDPRWDLMDSVFFVGLFVFCCIAASLTFSSLSGKGRRITELTLPASALEKFLVNWIIYVPLALLAFYVCFAVTDLIRCFIYSIVLDDSSNLHLFFNHANSDLELISPLGYPVAILTVLLGWYVLGSSVWPKNSVIKSTAALFVYGMLLILVGAWLSNTLFEPDMVYGSGWSEPGENSVAVFKGVCYGLAVICFALAYFRYRQTEVIQRW